jgi:HSP20 family molecular chaperone IbpA
MRNKEYHDLGRVMEELFSAAESIGTVFSEKMGFEKEAQGFNWDAKWDFYPFYSYPPTNIYIQDDRTLVFEFALAGFAEETITLEFKGNYLLLSAKAPLEEPGASGAVAGAEESTEGRHYFKRRLKLRSIEQQKYLVPEDKFDREAVEATFKNGILRVVVPPKVEAGDQAGQTIPIKTEE